ncbi:MAG: 30S ribosome-binding factor RbfA [Magnetococcales bacterium]|nr:30S ribosome-binding factor RbfA [Magnetococcales bacterium]
MTLRTERVGEAIRDEIANLLLRGTVKDPGLPTLLSITGVKVSPDLHYAVVYYSTPGDEAARKLAGKALTRAGGFLRGQVGKALRLRLTPELRFVLDDSVDRGERLSQVMRDIQYDTEPGTPEPEPTREG